MTPRIGIRSLTAHLIAAAMTAVMLGLAFAPVGWGWLAHLALVPAAALALRSVGGWRLGLSLYIASAAWWLVMIRWMIPVTGGGFVGLALYMAVYLPAALLLFRWLDRRLRLPAVVLLPVTWVSLEMIRGYILAGGFGWYALSHSQAPFLPEHGASRLIQIADLVGEHGVSFIVAMSNGLVVDLLTRPVRVPRVDGPGRINPTILRATIGWAAVFIAAMVYGQWRIGQHASVTTTGPIVGVVQTNVPQDNKDSGTIEERLTDWAELQNLTREAALQGASIIVWPETVTPAPVNEEAVAFFTFAAEQFELSNHFAEARMYRELADVRHQIQKLALELEVSILVGSGTDLREPYRHYNSAYLFRADGAVAAERYDKIHRVPFGEFVPWIEWFPGLKEWFIRVLTPYDHDYTLQQGESWTVFEVVGNMQGRIETVKLVTPICFEDTVPRVIRRLVHQDGVKQAQLIVNLTNDGWFSASKQPLQHLQIAVFRSVEHRVPTARAVNTGMSGFVDSVGRVGPVVKVGDAVQNVPGVAVHAVQLDSRSTLFGRIGHWPGLILLVLTGVLVLVGLFRRDKMKPAVEANTH